MLKVMPLALLLFTACSDAPEEDVEPMGDLGVYVVESGYEDCDAPPMLQIELRDDGTAIVTHDGNSEPTPWGIVDEILWLPDLNLRHGGRLWSANPLKLERQPAGGFTGDVAWHNEIGPWCHGTITLTRP